MLLFLLNIDIPSFSEQERASKLMETLSSEKVVSLIPLLLYLLLTDVSAA